MEKPQDPSGRQKKNVFEGVTLYHWLIVIIASCGWLFDCMDQRLFVLARESALKELLVDDAEALKILKTYIGYATTSMILGWATGGILFGMMSDKMGRVKTMVITLLIYSGFTGLSGTAQSWIDFTLYRSLVGLGVGGMHVVAFDLADTQGLFRHEHPIVDVERVLHRSGRNEERLEQERLDQHCNEERGEQQDR